MCRERCASESSMDLLGLADEGTGLWLSSTGGWACSHSWGDPGWLGVIIDAGRLPSGDGEDSAVGNAVKGSLACHECRDRGLQDSIEAVTVSVAWKASALLSAVVVCQRLGPSRPGRVLSHVGVGRCRALWRVFRSVRFVLSAGLSHTGWSPRRLLGPLASCYMPMMGRGVHTGWGAFMRPRLLKRERRAARSPKVPQ